MRIVFWVMVGLALLIAAVKVPVPFGPNSGAPTPVPYIEPVRAQPPVSIDRQLATIQGSGSVDQQTLTRITYDLDTLSRECVESRETIGNAANTSHDLLLKAGINESISSILDAELRGADAAGGHAVQCNQVLAAYVALREHGN